MDNKLRIKVMRSSEDKEPLRIHHDELVAKIPYFSHERLSDRTFIAAIKDEKIVGLVSLVNDSFRIPGALGVGFVSVHEDFRRQGVAKSLVQGLFELAEAQRQDIANTSYEPEGLMWLKPLMTRTAQEFTKVKLFER